MVTINHLAVFVAALSSLVLGCIWYGPLFGKPWMRLAGLSHEKIAEAKKKGMAGRYSVMLIGTVVMSYVLWHEITFAIAFFGVSGIGAGLEGGFWIWLGFIAPVLMGAVLWEGKSWTLWLINAGYYLLSLMLMGGILASWM
ncbi:DUF1761 domain-containing protein [Candidatus Uhrbacteria bacterium]|nr:DUF1761 domain-containing protein [Candidatus Uhrbacteria bacterium]